MKKLEAKQRRENRVSNSKIALREARLVLVCPLGAFYLEDFLGNWAIPTKRELGILILRNGLTDGKQKTLEYVGRKYGITRERVRQLEAHAIRRLKSLGEYIEKYPTMKVSLGERIVEEIQGLE